MSNTYKDKIRGKLRRAGRRRNSVDDYLKYCNSLSDDQQKTIVNYNKNPSWYNHMINNVPKRRHDKTLCRLMKDIRCEEYDNFMFSDDRKPSSWYW